MACFGGGLQSPSASSLCHKNRQYENWKLAWKVLVVVVNVGAGLGVVHLSLHCRLIITMPQVVLAAADDPY